MGYFYVFTFLVSLLILSIYSNREHLFGKKPYFRKAYHIEGAFDKERVQQLISDFQSNNLDYFVKEDLDAVMGKLKYKVSIANHKECSFMVRIFFKEFSIELAVISCDSSNIISKKSYEIRNTAIEQFLKIFNKEKMELL